MGSVPVSVCVSVCPCPRSKVNRRESWRGVRGSSDGRTETDSLPQPPNVFDGSRTGSAFTRHGLQENTCSQASNYILFCSALFFACTVLCWASRARLRAPVPSPSLLSPSGGLFHIQQTPGADSVICRTNRLYRKHSKHEHCSDPPKPVDFQTCRLPRLKYQPCRIQDHRLPSPKQDG